LHRLVLLLVHWHYSWHQKNHWPTKMVQTCGRNCGKHRKTKSFSLLLKHGRGWMELSLAVLVVVLSCCCCWYSWSSPALLCLGVTSWCRCWLENTWPIPNSISLEVYRAATIVLGCHDIVTVAIKAVSMLSHATRFHHTLALSSPRCIQKTQNCDKRFCHAMVCISAAYAVMRCLSVCHVREFCRNE